MDYGMRGLIGDLKMFADAVERLAFKMPPPNEWTPQFVQLAQAAKMIALEHEAKHQADYRDLWKSMSTQNADELTAQQESGSRGEPR